MNRAKYRLQSVMDARERLKQERARLVASRRAQLDEAERELARRESALEECRELQRAARAKMFAEGERGAEARRLVEHRLHLSDLREREQESAAAVAQQRLAVARAERELEGALANLAEASKEFRVVETHREHWREDERRAGVRREQKLGDEVAATLRRRGPK
jgi:flagellar biosynthesis chaperone FliJ